MISFQKLSPPIFSDKNQSWHRIENEIEIDRFVKRLLGVEPILTWLFKKRIELKPSPYFKKVELREMRRGRGR